MAEQASKRALRAIQAMIFSGALRQGDEFYENQLVEMLQMSRTPIREALVSLENDGLIERTPQVGIRVRKFTDADVEELYEAREFLEVRSAVVLAERATAEDVYKLEDLLRGMTISRERDDKGEFLRHDVEFHWRIAELAGLSLYRDWLQQIGDRLRVFGFRAEPTHDEMGHAVAEHGRILAALSDRNPDFARSHTRAHLHEVMKRIESYEHRSIFKAIRATENSDSNSGSAVDEQNSA